MFFTKVIFVGSLLIALFHAMMQLVFVIIGMSLDTHGPGSTLKRQRQQIKMKDKASPAPTTDHCRSELEAAENDGWMHESMGQVQPRSCKNTSIT